MFAGGRPQKPCGGRPVRQAAPHATQAIMRHRACKSRIGSFSPNPNTTPDTKTARKPACRFAVQTRSAYFA